MCPTVHTGFRNRNWNPILVAIQLLHEPRKDWSSTLVDSAFHRVNNDLGRAEGRSTVTEDASHGRQLCVWPHIRIENPPCRYVRVVNLSGLCRATTLFMEPSSASHVSHTITILGLPIEYSSPRILENEAILGSLGCHTEGVWIIGTSDLDVLRPRMNCYINERMPGSRAYKLGIPFLPYSLPFYFIVS